MNPSERNRKLDNLESTVKQKERSLQEANRKYEQSIEKHQHDLEAVNKQCEQYRSEIGILKQSRTSEEEAISTNLIQIKVAFFVLLFFQSQTSY